MRRRSRLAALLAVAVVACGAGCAAPERGPREIHWDRDTCEQCSMSIGDRHHAAQLRLATERKAHLFDDPGCALDWLDAHGHDLEDAEIWVRDPSGERWVDAHAARYQRGATTPMGYGFATTEARNGLTLEDVALRLRERNRERRSPGS